MSGVEIVVGKGNRRGFGNQFMQTRRVIIGAVAVLLVFERRRQLQSRAGVVVINIAVGNQILKVVCIGIGVRAAKAHFVIINIVRHAHHVLRRNQRGNTVGAVDHTKIHHRNIRQHHSDIFPLLIEHRNIARPHGKLPLVFRQITEILVTHIVPNNGGVGGDRKRQKNERSIEI